MSTGKSKWLQQLFLGPNLREHIHKDKNDKLSFLMMDQWYIRILLYMWQIRLRLFYEITYCNIEKSP